VDFLTFWLGIERLLLGPERVVSREIQAEFESIWNGILTIPDGARRVNFRSEDLAPIVERAFAAVPPSWQMGRYHSPDIMIAASSAEAVQRGEYFPVLGC